MSSNNFVNKIRVKNIYYDLVHFVKDTDSSLISSMSDDSSLMKVYVDANNDNVYVASHSDVIKMAGENKTMTEKIGDVKVDIDDVKSNLLKRNNLVSKEIRSGAYINSSGGISTGSAAFIVAVYDIEPNTIYNVYNTYHVSTAARNFAVYSSTEISSSNCIFVSDTENNSQDNTLYNNTNGVILAISSYASNYEYALQECEYFNLQNIDEAVTTVVGEVNTLTKEILSEVEREDFTRISSTYISDDNGNTSTHSSYNLDYYEVNEGEKYTIEYSGNIGNLGARSFGMYSALPFDSTTKVGDVGVRIGDNESLTIEADIVEGANYLATVSMNGTQYQTFTRTVKEISSIKNTVDALAAKVDEDVLDINQNITNLSNEFKTLYTDLEVTDWVELTKTYITNDAGNIGTFNAYHLDYFEVNEGEVYDIVISVVGANAAARSYAMYSDYPFSTENKVGTVGARVGAGITTSVEIVAGARYLAVCGFNTTTYPQYTRTITKKNAKFITETVGEIQTDVDEIKNELVNSTSGDMCVELDNDGESLYIAYLENSSTEITYWFKKCMSNKLYTFYTVGYRTVDRDYADTVNISSDTNIVVFNQTSSDNIGPMYVRTSGGDTYTVGGNHHYPNETAETLYLTAQNVSYQISVEGKVLNAGDKVYSNQVEINVVNHIFDPAFPPAEGATSLSTVFSTESVFYKVKKNSIEVSVRQKYSDTTTSKVTWYLGMQSMFASENYVMTPNAEWTNWTAPSNKDMSKENYPNFNRFVERNTNLNTFQSTYLITNKLGNHTYATNVFHRSGGKDYHSLIQGQVLEVASKSLVWSGVYTFFHTPILNDSNAFVYRGIINGKDAVFVNTIQSCDIEIELPNDLLLRKMNVVEQSNTITTENTFTDVVGVQLTATGTGSFIFTLE